MFRQWLKENNLQDMDEQIKKLREMRLKKFTPMYHGSTIKDLNYMRFPIWVTPSLKTATNYSGKDGQVYTVLVRLGNNIFDAGVDKEEITIKDFLNIDIDNDKKQYKYLWLYDKKVIEHLKDKGYTAVKLIENGEITYLIFNEMQTEEFKKLK